MNSRAPSWARALAEQQAGIRAELAHIRALLEQQSGNCRRGGDVAIREALAPIVGAKPFSTADAYLALCAVAPRLLSEHGIATKFMLAARFSRMVDAGLLRRAGDTRKGILWTCDVRDVLPRTRRANA